MSKVKDVEARDAVAADEAPSGEAAKVQEPGKTGTKGPLRKYGAEAPVRAQEPGTQGTKGTDVRDY